MRQKILFLLFSLDFLLILGIYHSFARSDNNFHLIFCNVGQGDGILIRSAGGFDVIIDGGPRQNSMTECLDRHLPFWDRTIDAVYLTHPDADHLTGLIGVVESYNVLYFGTSKAPKDTEVYNELMDLLKERGIKVDWVFRDDKVITKRGLEIKALWPTYQFQQNPSEDTNDYSLVQLVTFGNFKALLTGDAPSVYLNSLMPTVGTVDIFKPPHHGSKTGIDEFTFQHVDSPKLAVISAGKTNRYGHPSKEVLQILKEKDIPTSYTFEADIEIISDGRSWWKKN